MSFFTIEELNTHNAEITPEIETNLKELIAKLDQVREAYGHPMVVTSGLRSQADQMRINPKAPKSKHMLGQAADISDADGHLKAWVKSNVPLMGQIGLWFEAFDATPSWCHMQSVPPKSGARFFNP